MRRLRVIVVVVLLVATPNRGLSVLLAIIVIAIVATCALSLFGTAFPAAVAKRRLDFATVFAAGKASFSFVLLRLIFFTGPVYVAIFAFNFGLNAVGLAQSGVFGGGSFSAPTLFAEFVNALAGFYATSIATVILCRAYMRTWGEEPVDVDVFE